MYFNGLEVEVLSQMYENLCEMFPATEEIDEHAAVMGRFCLA